MKKKQYLKEKKAIEKFCRFLQEKCISEDETTFTVRIRKDFSNPTTEGRRTGTVTCEFKPNE